MQKSSGEKSSGLWHLYKHIAQRHALRVCGIYARSEGLWHLCTHMAQRHAVNVTDVYWMQKRPAIEAKEA
jgi:hypothetical protein